MRCPKNELILQRIVSITVMNFMKKILSLLFCILAISFSYAQTLHDGFYRVKNVGTQRYIYVFDNTGSLNMTAGTVEAGALATWSAAGRDFVSDPASIIYLKTVSDKFDFLSQGTSVHQIISHYVSLYKKGSSYQIYAQQSGLTKYLSDERDNLKMAYGYLGTSKTGDFRLWDVYEVSSSDDSNYFGVTPTISVDGKYYQPFYAGFAFKLASPGMKVYYVSRIDGDKVCYREWTKEVIPASMPVIIECSSDKAQENKLDLLMDSSKALSAQQNLLSGVYFANPDRPKSVDSKTVYDTAKMRVLGVTSDGKLGFVQKSTTNPVALTNNKGKQLGDHLAANQAYLPCEAGTPAELLLVMDESSAIDDLEVEKATSAPIYNLSGMMVRKAGESADGLESGFYVQDGRVIKF